MLCPQVDHLATAHTMYRYQPRYHILRTVEQFDRCQVLFNEGLQDLQRHIRPTTDHERPSIDAALLMLYMVSMATAMTLYLQRAYALLPQLPVQYEREETPNRSVILRRVRNQPYENIWLSGVMNKLELAYNEFSRIVLQFCRAKNNHEHFYQDGQPQTHDAPNEGSHHPQEGHHPRDSHHQQEIHHQEETYPQVIQHPRPLKPVLRSYNSFSTLSPSSPPRSPIPSQHQH